MYRPRRISLLFSFRVRPGMAAAVREPGAAVGGVHRLHEPRRDRPQHSEGMPLSD